MSKIDHLIGDATRMMAVSQFGGSIMPQANRKIASSGLYTIQELIDLRRQMLLFARSLPRGPKRNDRRQTANSLRRLYKNKAWLSTHTVEESQ
ncbi:hypothetical protein [Bradyrhizobium erythrophlei]|nr:hypothetical protein [Bradyrhizobium erythrophlei]